MWKNYINKISKEYSFKSPASQAEITQITKELNIELPKKLLELLSETNGVFDSFNCPLRNNENFTYSIDKSDIYL